MKIRWLKLIISATVCAVLFLHTVGVAQEIEYYNPDEHNFGNVALDSEVKQVFKFKVDEFAGDLLYIAAILVVNNPPSGDPDLCGPYPHD